MTLHTYQITSLNREIRDLMTTTRGSPVVEITCKDNYQAWRKFVAQQFGHLKPARKDWKIEKKP